MARDILPEAMEAGHRLLEEQEQRRQQLIALYEEDGLMPYERRPTKLISPTED